MCNAVLQLYWLDCQNALGDQLRRKRSLWWKLPEDLHRYVHSCASSLWLKQLPLYILRSHTAYSYDPCCIWERCQAITYMWLIFKCTFTHIPSHGIAKDIVCASPTKIMRRHERLCYMSISECKSTAENKVLNSAEFIFLSKLLQWTAALVKVTVTLPDTDQTTALTSIHFFKMLNTFGLPFGRETRVHNRVSNCMLPLLNCHPALTLSAWIKMRVMTTGKRFQRLILESKSWGLSVLIDLLHCFMNSSSQLIFLCLVLWNYWIG